MAASDDLKKLADRAKAAEDHAAVAKTQARAELQKTVTGVRASAEAGAKKFQTQTQAAGQKASDSWNDVQRSWNAHMDKARKDIDHRKAKFDASDAKSAGRLGRVERRAVDRLRVFRDRGGGVRRPRCDPRPARRGRGGRRGQPIRSPPPDAVVDRRIGDRIAD